MLAPALPARPARPRIPWGWRLREVLAAYLPLLLMALLAAGTWWLVKNTPATESSTERPALRHEPDYTMRDFSVQRFAPDGRLAVQLEGSVLRHYPDTDTLEVDEVRLHAWSARGGETVAHARQALSNGDATQVQLRGGAHVTGASREGLPPIEFEGEFLQADLDTEQLHSHLPVVVRREGTSLRGDTMRYDNLARVAELRGHVRASFAAVPPRAAPAASAAEQ